MWYVLENENKSMDSQISREKTQKRKQINHHPILFQRRKKESGCLEDPLGAWEKA